MGFFTKFKMLFNKSIAILPHQRGDLVSFVKLKNGMVKIGTELVVEKDYNLVIVYYNRVCDVLKEGIYKIDEVSTPKLFRFSKAYFTKRGLFTANTIKADAYYINLNTFKHNIFKTPERIIAYNGDEKVKIKLDGNFTLQVVDAEKLMRALCSDYAIIRNKKTMKEIRSTVGFDVSKILNSKNFSLADYMANKEKIVEALNQEVNINIEKYGLMATDFFINKVILPKKYLDQKFNEKDQNVEKEGQIDIVKIVEERLNSLEKDLNIVYKKPDSVETHTVKQGARETVSINVANNTQNFNNQENNSQASRESSSVNSEPNKEENIFVADNRSNEDSSSQVFTMPYGGENTNSTTTVGSSFDQPEPEIFKQEPKIEEAKTQPEITDEFIDGMIDKIEKRKRQKKRERVAEILGYATMTVSQEEPKQVISVKNAKTKKCNQCGAMLEDDAKFCSKCGKSTDELIVCPCCGAKNFPSSQVCCVCKSNLN